MGIEDESIAFAFNRDCADEWSRSEDERETLKLAQLATGTITNAFKRVKPEVRFTKGQEQSF